MTFRINRALGLPLACALAALLIASGGAAPEFSARQFEVMGWEMAERLRGQDDKEASDAIRAFQNIHDRFVSSALRIIDVDSKGAVLPGDRRLAAAELLAHLRKREALPILVRRIETGPQTVSTQLLPLGKYPYAVALASFREAAIAPIFGFLKRDHIEEITDTAIDLYAHLLIDCAMNERKPLDHAISIVAQEIARTPGAEQQQGLKRVLARLQEIAKGPLGSAGC